MMGMFIVRPAYFLSPCQSAKFGVLEVEMSLVLELGACSRCMQQTHSGSSQECREATKAEYQELRRTPYYCTVEFIRPIVETMRFLELLFGLVLLDRALKASFKVLLLHIGTIVNTDRQADAAPYLMMYDCFATRVK